MPAWKPWYCDQCDKSFRARQTTTIPTQDVRFCPDCGNIVVEE